MQFDSCPHGGGIEAAAHRWQCAVSDIVDLSTGLHPAGAPAWMAQWLQQHAELVARYPDINGEPARSALAGEFGVHAEQVIMLAGAQAMIEVVFQAMRWRSLAIRTPCYREPLRCAERAGCRIVRYAIDEAIPDAEAFWITSPSNPYGDEQPCPEGRAGVLDESYMRFAQRRALGIIPGVIRLGSLTKTFGIPGLRLAYAIAEPQAIEALARWLPPWPASTLGLHALPRLLAEADERDQANQQGVARLERLLRSRGWQTWPSSASFVLARSHACPAEEAEYRILLRRFPEWPTLQHCVRFGIPGSPQAWLRLEGFLGFDAGRI